MIDISFGVVAAVPLTVALVATRRPGALSPAPAASSAPAR
ncbi:hypothetical protein QE418_000723 [Microbacterium testaceum]|nr:hypothetical protein [Microbacterium testaceum]